MKKRTKMVIIIIASVLLLAAAGTVIAVGVMKKQMSLIPSMSFNDMLAYTAKDSKDAVIAVGTIKDGKTEIVVYGENGRELSDLDGEFEIGSLTKTFTCSLLCKAISEGKVSLGDRIDKYIDLPEADYYPTLERLVTHTSGYRGCYFSPQMVGNFFAGGNSFYKIKTDDINSQLAKNTVEDKDYPFLYSNFGLSVVGEIAASVYGGDYSEVMTKYIDEELGLESTRISDGTGNLDGYWRWDANDAYMPAGAVISTITDMTRYLEIHMNNELPYLAYGHEQKACVPRIDESNAALGIRIDAEGVGWMIDRENGFVWHNGGTTEYNSYLAFDSESGVGVVILSNLAPGYKIPATVMGVKLLLELRGE